METAAFEVVCRRRCGRWEITLPDVPDLSLVIGRLEDVPAAARSAIARGQHLDAGQVPVMLDVHGR